MTSLRSRVELVSHLIWHLAKWLGRRSWDWVSVLFIVAGFWTWGGIVVSLAAAEPIPSTIEMGVGGFLLFCGGLVLVARIIHAAWSSSELPSFFQKVVATVLVSVLFGFSNLIGYRYLSSKVPTLQIDLSQSLPQPPEPPKGGSSDLPRSAPPIAEHESYLTLDGVPLFGGSNPNGIEGASFQPGDPLGFNLHFHSTGPEAIYMGAGAMETFLEPDDTLETLKSTYRTFLDHVVLDKRMPANREKERWQLFTQGMAEFNTAYVLDRTTGHPTVHRATQADLDDLKSGNLIAVVIAFLDYKDEGKIHHLWFCDFLQTPA